MKNFLLSIFTLSLIIISSCAKDDATNTEPIDYANLTGEQYLSLYTTPDIFFHYARFNENDESVTGWFVDNEGQVYTYDVETEVFDTDGPIIKKSRLSALIEKANLTDRQIDLDDLVEYYKKTRAAASGDFDLGHYDVTATSTTFINAYDLQMGSGDCYNCPTTQVSADENAQIVLKASGRTNGEIDHPAADEIRAWLNDLDEDMN